MRNNSLFPIDQKISIVHASAHTVTGEQVCMRCQIHLHLNTGKSDGTLFIPLTWKQQLSPVCKHKFSYVFNFFLNYFQNFLS